jgi:beta-mannosidase
MGTSLLHSEFDVEGMTNCNTLEKSVSRDHMLPASRENEVYFHRGLWFIPMEWGTFTAARLSLF